MRNKILVFWLMMAVVGFMIGFDYGQAHADARAGVGPADWAHAGAYAHAFVSHGGNSCVDLDDGQTPPNRHAFCTSTNGHGSSGDVEANTWSSGNGWILAERVEGRVQPGDCFFFGKLEPKFRGEGFVLDTIRLEVDISIAGKLIRRVTGLIKLHPSKWSASVQLFDLKAGNLDESIMCFDNHGWFDGSAVTIYGNPQIIPTTNILAGDTLEVTFSETDTIVCSIPHDEISILLEKWGFMNNAPTITQWGLVVLVGLIVASAVFIMLRRRRASAAA
jgi:hypothetical protein